MSFEFGGFATPSQVFDMPTSLACNRDVLGFQVAKGGPADDQCDGTRPARRDEGDRRLGRRLDP